MDISVTLGYAIAIATVTGSVAVIALMAVAAIRKSLQIFKPSTRKTEMEQIPTKSLPINENVWTCPYCGSQNEKTNFVCGNCRSPRKHLGIHS